MNDRLGSLPEPCDAGDEKLLSDVREHGWHVLKIPEDDEGPAFAYSVGLQWSFRHPEVVVFGLDLDLMHQMINMIGERIRNGDSFRDRDEAGDVLEGFNVTFRQVAARYHRAYFGYALWLAQSDTLSVLQVAWPDRQHRYPWDADFPQELAARQPVFW
ncbi:MAG: DUF4262 domain-containing protein [Planctomycetaceae bacterium]|nr:DUF4262 domain-containing protein [Planctomycetaceae bacterium]